MFQTSPIIMTSLKLKDVLNYKQEPTAHAINIEARKASDKKYHLTIGVRPYKHGFVHIDMLQQELELVVEAYCKRIGVNTQIQKGEIERLKKLLV